MVKQNTHFDKVDTKNNEMFSLFSVSSISEKLFDGRDLESSNVAVSFEGQLLHKVIPLKQYSSLH